MSRVGTRVSLRVLAVLSLLGLATLVPSPAVAADLNAIWPDLGLPGFKITPFVSERVEYESNIFQTERGPKDDGISKTIPGFVLELPLGRHKIDLGFRTEILRYFNLTNQDTEHYFVLGNLLLDFPGGLKMGLKEDFARTSDPPGTELTGRIGSTTNVLAPSIEYGFARRYALGFEYVFTHVNFDHNSGVETLDRDEHTFGVTGFYKIQPQTNQIYIGNQVTLSAEHFLTRKLLLSGRLFGATNDYFEKARQTNGRFAWRYDIIGAASVGIEYVIQRWLTVSADYTYTRRESNFDTFDFRNDIVGAKVTLSF